MASYHPLGQGGYSPSLRPSIAPEDIADNDNLDLEGYGAPVTKSRSPSPPRGVTDYNSYRYSNPPEDIEAEGLINEKYQYQQPELYRTYKRRWIGLAELTLLSFAIGWGWTAPGVLAETAMAWFKVDYPTLNYLSIAGSLVFLVPAPFTIWILNKFGPKTGILIACFFAVVGNWVIYIGTMKHSFSINIAGTIIHTIAMPFALCAPTRYSRQWFDDHGRVLATALPSLAYPMGTGFGALTGPYMVQPIGPLRYDQQALIIACLFTAIAIPAPFIPNKPPTPPSRVSAATTLGWKKSLKSLFTNPIFFLQFFTFAILVAAIDTATGITNEATEPYGFTQQEASDAIAVLIFVGIGAACVVSPLLDRFGHHEIVMKIFVTIIAISYTILPWIPQTHSVPALYVLYAIIGASSLSLEPCVLEYQASSTHPVSPEFSSVVLWCGCKITGVIFTFVVGNVLQAKKAEEGQPIGSEFNGLLLIAGLAWVAAISTYLMGVWIFKRPETSKI